ncbi:MAG: TerD family protein [Alphaproteobacteria bacterium]|nr:TerD family protein [Alphaproteobacteria bacterium]
MKDFRDEINRVKKGDSVNLTKKDPTLRQLVIGLGWDVRSFENEKVDMDASCFVVGRDGKTRVDSDFVFYNNLKGVEGAVRHTGDNRTGAGDGDDETIFVDLNGLPFEVDKVIFVVSIYHGNLQGQDFSQVRNVFLRIGNQESGEEICRYELDDLVGGEAKQTTAITVGSINREGPQWVFYAIGDTHSKGLGSVASTYGIIVQGE